MMIAYLKGCAYSGRAGAISVAMPCRIGASRPRLKAAAQRVDNSGVPGRRRSRFALAAAVLGGALGAPFGSVAGPPLVARAASADSSVDYATEAFGDPWDYSNAQDQILSAEGPMFGATDASIDGGQLHFTMAGPGFFDPLYGGYLGALVHDRDGVAHPIDASRFGRIVFRMNASAEVPAGIRWHTCLAQNDACQGGFGFLTVPGWHTYDFALVASAEPNLTTPWTGDVVALRVAFSPSAPSHFDVDWLRVVPVDARVDGPYDGPVPVIDQPDQTGGTDYATVARHGDAWDFSEASDVQRSDNVVGSVHDGVYDGTNSGPVANDPSVGLRLATTFSGDQFHRATVSLTYDGPFSLGDREGGGMAARLLWRIANTPLTHDGSDLQHSEFIALYPNAKSFTVDLATSPPAAITDEGQRGPRIGWAGQMIEMLRIDPNEDRGTRHWRIDDVKLADDDATDPSGTFDIVWHDDAWRPDTVADLAFDTDARGFDATPIASGLHVVDGPNHFLWTPPPGLRGPVYIVVRHSRDGLVARRYSTGPVRVDGPNVGPSFRFGPAVGGPSSQAGHADVNQPSARSATSKSGGEAVKTPSLGAGPGLLALVAPTRTKRANTHSSKALGSGALRHAPRVLVNTVEHR